MVPAVLGTVPSRKNVGTRRDRSDGSQSQTLILAALDLNITFDLLMIKSVRSRVLILLFSTSAVLLGASMFNAVERRNAEIQAAIKDQEALAEAIASRQRLVFEHTQHVLSMLAKAVDLPSILAHPRCAEVLGKFVARDPQIANIFMVTPQGDTLCNQVRPAPSLNLTDRVFVQRALAQSEPVIGEALVGRFTGKRVLPVAQRIDDAKGHAKGLIVVALDLAWVIREARSGHLSRDARIGLMDATGEVISQYPDPAGAMGNSIYASKEFLAAQKQGFEGTLDVVSADHVARLVTFYTFAETVKGRVYFYVSQRKESITTGADRQLTLDLLVAALGVIAAFAAAWWGSERWLIHPIRHITAAAQQLGNGNHLARTGLPVRQDELGKLAQVFDQMATDLSSNNDIVRLNRALQVLSKSNRALVHAQREAELLDEICRIAVDVGGYRLAWVGFAERDAEHTVRVIARHGVDDGYVSAARISWADDERGSGPTGTAIRTGQNQINRDFASNAKVGLWRDAALAHGFRSSASFPLISGSVVLGALTIYSTEADAFSGQEVLLLRELADDLAFGINARRVQKAHDETLERLERVLETTVQAVATTVEFRDPYTAGHQRRVASFAVAIARKLQLSEHDIQGIHLAGVVHDIGKIRVPEYILVKPERLTEEEFGFLRKHPETGYEILKDIDFPWPIAEMVLQHHERMDGNGYPRGLKGEAIHIGARIIAVADVVEAMGLNRPYRKGLGLDMALDEVRKGRGLRYDEQVVDACIELLTSGEFSFAEA